MLICGEVGTILFGLLVFPGHDWLGILHSDHRRMPDEVRGLASHAFLSPLHYYGGRRL
jgi:hypothetical protein